MTNVAKRYGPVVALKSAELVVEPGEIHALLGANGAGKSTLVKILTGVIRHDSGTIAVNGEPVRIASPEGARKVGFAPVFQDPAMLPDLTVAQNLRPDAHRHRGHARVARAHGADRRPHGDDRRAPAAHAAHARPGARAGARPASC